MKTSSTVTEAFGGEPVIRIETIFGSLGRPQAASAKVKAMTAGRITPSLPLDRGGRLRRDVVDDAIDPAHLVDDAVRQAPQDLVGELRPVGGHSVERADG